MNEHIIALLCNIGITIWMLILFTYSNMSIDYLLDINEHNSSSITDTKLANDINGL